MHRLANPHLLNQTSQSFLLILLLVVVTISCARKATNHPVTNPVPPTNEAFPPTLEPKPITKTQLKPATTVLNSAPTIPVHGNSVSSSTLAVSPNGKFVAAVNPDSDSVTLVDTASLSVLSEIPVGDDPRTLSFTPDSKQVVVANHGSATISKFDLDKPNEVTNYQVGSMPYGIVTDGLHAFVTEFGIGTVSIIDLMTGKMVSKIPVDDFPAGLALNSNRQQLYVTHFFTGKVTVIDQQTYSVIGTVNIGGGSNISQFIYISPDNKYAYLPQTRSNVANTALLFDSTVFPVVNVIDLSKLQLSVPKRITLDTADRPVNIPFSLAISPDGNILYIANAGSNDVSVIDLITNRNIAHINVGSNPRGIANTPDGSVIFVNNVLDGTLSVIEAETNTLADDITLTQIPLQASILVGKKLFNSSDDPILSTDNWISCATCHFNGMMDSRTWHGFPDGPRNTPSLSGVGATLPIHWSGDFDELQDVEITIRDIQFGDGLLTGPTNDSLTTTHAGLSKQLDSLAIYMASIPNIPSPNKKNRESIKSGRALFSNLGCNSCHMAPLYTDKQLHDVGTGDPLKEKNSHGRGTNFDTPSLNGIWMTAPYFHDGSASTLKQVLQTGNTHNIANKLEAKELEELIAFLESLPEPDK